MFTEKLRLWLCIRSYRRIERFEMYIAKVKEILKLERKTFKQLYSKLTPEQRVMFGIKVGYIEDEK